MPSLPSAHAAVPFSAELYARHQPNFKNDFLEDAGFAAAAPDGSIAVLVHTFYNHVRYNEPKEKEFLSWVLSVYSPELELCSQHILPLDPYAPVSDMAFDQASRLWLLHEDNVAMRVALGSGEIEQRLDLATHMRVSPDGSLWALVRVSKGAKHIGKGQAAIEGEIILARGEAASLLGEAPRLRGVRAVNPGQYVRPVATPWLDPPPPSPPIVTELKAMGAPYTPSVFTWSRALAPFDEGVVLSLFFCQGSLGPAVVVDRSGGVRHALDLQSDTTPETPVLVDATRNQALHMSSTHMRWFTLSAPDPTATADLKASAKPLERYRIMAVTPDGRALLYSPKKRVLALGSLASPDELVALAEPHAAWLKRAKREQKPVNGRWAPRV